VNHPAGEYRAELDFEITFANGGSLRGREFLIDIEHPGMSEDELAEALIRDLGLLMVGRVDIHSRQVMRAQHRRAQPRSPVPQPAAPLEPLVPLPEPGALPDLHDVPAADGAPAPPADADAPVLAALPTEPQPEPATEPPPAAAAAGPGAAEVRHRADLSHVIEDGMITYPGLPVPQIKPDSVSSVSRGSYAPGVEFRIGEVTICGNTGTYLDSPYHRYPDADDLSELPLGKLAELDGVRVDVTGSDQRAIGRSLLLPYDCRGKAVLIHTGWDQHWGTGEYFRNHPFLTADAATYLAGTGAVLVGIDSLNIDDTGDPERPVHSLLLAAGIPVCEHLTGLDGLPAAGFRFSAVPPKLRPFGTFPVRAYATW
jgi:kynurenine formamidase